MIEDQKHSLSQADTTEPEIIFSIVVRDGKRFYKDQEVNTVLSYRLKCLIENFLQNGAVEVLLKERYGIKAAVTGSLEKLAAVRDGKINDLDIVLVTISSNQPVADGILEKVKFDKEFYLLLLKFLATIDDPTTALGKFFAESHLVLLDKSFDVLGQIIDCQISGFNVSPLMFKIRFGETWDGTVEEPDRFARLAAEIYAEVTASSD